MHALTGDDQAAEISIAVPVDEMTHAMLAQAQLLHRASRTSPTSTPRSAWAAPAVSTPSSSRNWPGPRSS
ncbi:hypothetical protein SMALA_2827 [Streptomyces malaysiensis subsp. malaysiensis]|nr:hypothetical protein SMALA_2827 [Streptomyces malaysiensis]